MDSKNKSLKKEFLKLKEEVEPHIQKGGAKNKNHLQGYLYFACFPLFSFVESIIILCESRKFRTSESLLRSLVELHINVTYYQVAESDRRLAISVKKEFDHKLKVIREIKKLIGKYPNLKSDDSTNLLNNEWLEKTERWAEEYRQTVLKGNHLNEGDKEPFLKNKAIKCDQAGMKDTERGHFERMYQVIYRQLSPSTHLDIAGIQGFIDQKENDEYTFSNGDQKGYFLMQEAVSICVSLVKDLYEKKVIEADLPDTIGKLEKLLM